MNNKIKNIILGLVAGNKYMQDLGLEFLDMDEGYMYVRIPVHDGIVNPYGSVHGGALYSLADIGAGFCAATYGNFVSTSTGNLIYIAPAMDTDYVYCEARTLHRGNKIISVSVEIKSDTGKLLDTGAFTFCRLNKEL